MAVRTEATMRRATDSAYGSSSLLGCAIVLAIASLLAVPATAQVTVTTPMKFDSDAKVGFRYRRDVTEASTATMAHEPERAWALLEPVIGFCDGLGEAGVDIISVASVAEYDEYMATAGHGKPTEWIDTACPSAYKAAAFLHVEAKRIDDALRFLDKASALAPYWAEPFAERGYLLNTSGRASEALDAYARGLELIDKFPSNAYAKAIMLRGVGYAHVELGNLELAEKAYRDSLAIDPESDVAKREIEFIERAQRKR